jgi:hypothetical protein
MGLGRTTHLALYLGLAAAGGGAMLAGWLFLPGWSVSEVAHHAWLVVEEHLWLYWCLVYTALAGLIAQAAIPLVQRDLAGSTSFWTSRTVFAVLTIATVLLARWPGLAPVDIDPDESEDLAIALALREDPRYWVSAEGGTHGPLVEFALLPVQLFGMELEYGAARLVGLALLLACLFFQFATLRTFFPERISRAAMTPPTVTIAFVTSPALIAYNAYYPTMFLGCAGALGCARLATGPATGVSRRALATGLALGLVPFSKLQAVPIAFTLAGLGVLCVVLRFRGRRRQQGAALLALCAGGLGPAALVALYLWSQDLFSHFWVSYIGSNFGYASKAAMSTYAKFRFFLEWAPESLGNLFLPYFGSTIAIGLLLLCLARRGGWPWKLLLAGTAVLTASVYSVIASGYAFEDYLWFLVFPVTFLAGVVLAALYETERRGARRLLWGSVSLASVVIVTSLHAHQEDRLWPSSDPDQTDAVAELIRQYARPGERLVVWGYKDAYHVLTGLPPATLECTYRTIQWKSAKTARGDYFYRLFLRQFDQARPPVFVQAAGWAPILFKEDEWGLENFPELRNRVAARYVLVAEVDEARVYVAKERLAEQPSTPEIPLPLVPVAQHRMAWDEGVARGDSGDSFLVFALPYPLWVKAVRVTCAYETAGSPATFRMLWKRRSGEGFVKERAVTVKVNPGDGAQAVTLPVTDTVAQLRIYPDSKPSAVTIKEIVVQSPQVLSEDQKYEQLTERLREAVRTAVPAGATVLVISKGDEALVQLPGRTGWHFPRAPGGGYLGYDPEDSNEAIARLERLRAKGAQFLVIPSTYLWWLDEEEGYKEFKQYLETRGRLVADVQQVCLIYALR